MEPLFHALIWEAERGELGVELWLWLEEGLTGASMAFGRATVTSVLPPGLTSLWQTQLQVWQNPQNGSFSWPPAKLLTDFQTCAAGLAIWARGTLCDGPHREGPSCPYCRHLRVLAKSRPHFHTRPLHLGLFST